MIEDINKIHTKKSKVIKGKKVSVKQNIKLYAHNGAGFDAYIILQQ